MFFTKPDLTAGSRPALLSDEDLLFVQDGVGLYEGDFKIASCQKGHAYLTSHRACYIDDIDPRNNSLAVDLKDVERHEFQAKWLRQSPKVTLIPKPQKRGYGSLRQHIEAAPASRGPSVSSPVSRVPSPFKDAPARATTPVIDRGVWVCKICSFSNPVPSNFDPTIANESFPLPPCLTCGIKPEFAQVLRAAISSNTKRPPERLAGTSLAATAMQNSVATARATQSNGNINTCPRCTFGNHPSMRVCEVCGAALPSQEAVLQSTDFRPQRQTSPGPEIANLNINDVPEDVSIKLSFRGGGDRAFYEKLKSAMVQRKWLLQHAPPIPRTVPAGASAPETSLTPPPSRPQSTSVGIAGLEARGIQGRRTNEAVLGNAFGDLEALMASAKDIVALAESFAAEAGTGNSLLSESATALGMVATKDISGDSSNTLYITELSRNLAEYVTDAKRGILRSNGGIIGLVDLWAMINRSRNGVELISPTDFHRAAEAWDRLFLPLRLRQFRSGLLVVQPRDWTDEKTINQITNWLRSLQASAPEEEIPWDWSVFGCGITAQEAASRFGWSLGVANEELEMAEERGVLCREEGIEGLKFWLNYLVDMNENM